MARKAMVEKSKRKPKFDVRQSGAQKFKLSTWWGFTPHLTFYGRIVVNYAPW